MPPHPAPYMTLYVFIRPVVYPYAYLSPGYDTGEDHACYPAPEHKLLQQKHRRNIQNVEYDVLYYPECRPAVLKP